MGKRVSSETKKKVRDYLDAGIGHREIAERLGIGVATVSRIRHRTAPAGEAAIPDDHPKPDLGKLPEKRVDYVGMLNHAIARTSDRFDEKKDYHRVVIETDQPIALMKAADIHFGGLDVDYRAFKTHINMLFGVPRMYLQLFGDDLNLMVMHRVVSARHDIFTPNEQCRFLESMVDDMLQKGKILSMGWGNHSDEFTERTAGFGIVSSLLKYKVPYFRGLGYLDLVLRNSKGEERAYPMGFAHKVRFSSFMNPVHGNIRMEQMHRHFFGMRPLCREYITAHTHNPAIAVFDCLPEERVYYIKCGTFKTDCLYSQRYYGQGRIGVPTTVYHADRLEHVCFPTPWEAYRYMHGRDWSS